MKLGVAIVGVGYAGLSAETVQARQVLVCTNGYQDGTNSFLRTCRARGIEAVRVAPHAGRPTFSSPTAVASPPMSLISVYS